MMSRLPAQMCRCLGDADSGIKLEPFSFGRFRTSQFAANHMPIIMYVIVIAHDMHSMHILHTYKYAYIHTHTYIYIYIYTHTCNCSICALYTAYSGMHLSFSFCSLVDQSIRHLSIHLFGDRPLPIHTQYTCPYMCTLYRITCA